MKFLPKINEANLKVMDTHKWPIGLSIIDT
jgi:hypothetical protein